MVLTQVISIAVAVLAIVWHQQRSIERLRAELRAEFGALRHDVIDIRERLARVEGYLRIGIPDDVTAPAAGTGAGNPQA